MYYIGIDVGGTGIQTGLIDDKAQVIAYNSIPTQPELPFSEQMDHIAEAIHSLLKSQGVTPDQIERVGAGIPGIADHNGEVIKCANMRWYHLPFAEELKKRIHKPVFVDNDANVAALAESVAGVSAGTSSSVFITIGTGIGSGIIINGKIWKGFHAIGSELGHTIFDLDGVQCTCGNKGCLERYCSATAIIRMAKESLRSHPESLMYQMTHGNEAEMEAKIVFDAARKDDPVALDVYNRFISYLSQAIANVINLIDPEIIVLGGGVSKAGSFLLDAVCRQVPEYVVYNDQPMPEIRIATLGAKAGMIGAAMLS